jgi:hypothetical protein
LKGFVKTCKLLTAFLLTFNDKDLIIMELSGVDINKLQSSERTSTTKKPDPTVTPQHGGGGVYVPPKTNDSVTISAEASKALNDDLIKTYHGGGGVYVPPKKEN